MTYLRLIALLIYHHIIDERLQISQHLPFEFLLVVFQRYPLNFIHPQAIDNFKFGDIETWESVLFDYLLEGSRIWCSCSLYHMYYRVMCLGAKI